MPLGLLPDNLPGGIFQARLVRHRAMRCERPDGDKVQPQRYTLTCTYSLERVTGIVPALSSLGIGQITADETAEQPTSETRSSRD